MYSILIVDDEEKIRAIIRKYAEFEGHTVSEATNGMEAVAICKKQHFDIIVLDIMMPLLDGFSTCAEIRKLCETPIIMLSARSEEYDKINGFRMGIDDYVVKPFSPKELMLRIDAIMKRTSKPAAPKREVFVCGDLKIDFTARIVYVSDQKAELSPKEYDLLFYMIRNANIALTREKLICEVWGYDYYGDDRTLDTHIKLLRRSLGDCGKYIVTLRGVGYRFESEKH